MRASHGLEEEIRIKQTIIAGTAIAPSLIRISGHRLNQINTRRILEWSFGMAAVKISGLATDRRPLKFHMFAR